MRLWDAKTGKAIHTLHGHSNLIFAVAFTPDGRRLLSCDSDEEEDAPSFAKQKRGVVKIWDVATGQETFTFRNHYSGIRGLAIHPEGKLVASAGGDGVRLWDIATGQESGAIRKDGSPNFFRIAFSPDGKELASTSMDETTVRLWDPSTGRQIATLSGHSESCTNVAYSSDGQRLASASVDGTARLWNARAHALARPLRGYTGVVSVAFHPNGRLLAAGCHFRAIRLVDLTTIQVVHTFETRNGTPSRVVFSPDGQLLSSCGLQGVFDVWNLAERRQIRGFKDHQGTVSVVFSHDGKRLLTTSGIEENGRVVRGNTKFWDAQTGAELFIKDGRTLVGSCLALSSDGRKLATVRDDQKTVRVVDADTLQEILTLGSHAADISSLAFSLDGKLLASGSQDGLVRIWDATSGQSVSTFRAHNGAVFCICFHRDGNRVATCGGSSVKVWTATGGREVFLNEEGMVANIAFSPDGHLLAACDWGRSLRIWDATPVGQSPAPVASEER